MTKIIFDEKNERKSTENPLVYLDISIDGIYIGRIIIELFVDKVPKTAENFRQLCIGESGLSKDTQIPLTYKNSHFFKIRKQYIIFGGDITHNNGKGGESIYGENFENENFDVLHENRGFLTMAGGESNKNNSQFYITFSKTKSLNKKHVVFGQIIFGFGILRELEHVETREYDNKPILDCVISDCGECDKNLDITTCINYPYNFKYPEFVEHFIIPEGASETKLKLEAANELKDIGKELCKEGKWLEALKIYSQALRYVDTDIYQDYDDRTENDNIELGKLQSTLKTNKAICLLNYNRPRQAQKECSEVLFYEPDNIKARFKRAQARMKMDKLDEALDDMKIAVKEDPNNKIIRNEMAVLKKLLENRKDILKQNLSKLFK